MFVLFFFLTYTVFAVTITMFSSTASVGELLIFYQMIWGFAGLHGFTVILYCLGTRFLSERKWLLILIILGGAVYVVLLFLLPNPVTAFTVNDGWLNYVAMPLVLVVYAAILGFIYMFLVPLFVAIRLTGKTEGSDRQWIWAGRIGLLLSFVASILISAVQFTFPFMIYYFGLIIVAWLLIGIGAIQMGLLSRQQSG